MNLILPDDPKMISDHYSEDEFTCRCGCKRVCAGFRLIVCLEIARFELGGTPLFLTQLGGFRCNGNSQFPNWNEMRGGAAFSKHPTGNAADLYHGVFNSGQLYDYFNKRWPDRYGVIHYPKMNFVHFDVDSRAYRAVNQVKYT